jgi:hypothetical protein
MSSGDGDAAPQNMPCCIAQRKGKKRPCENLILSRKLAGFRRNSGHPNVY